MPTWIPNLLKPIANLIKSEGGGNKSQKSSTIYRTKSVHTSGHFQKNKNIFKICSYIQKTSPSPISAFKITIYNTKYTKIHKHISTTNKLSFKYFPYKRNMFTIYQHFIIHIIYIYCKLCIFCIFYIFGIFGIFHSVLCPEISPPPARGLITLV